MTKIPRSLGELAARRLGGSLKTFGGVAGPTPYPNHVNRMLRKNSKIDVEFRNLTAEMSRAKDDPEYRSVLSGAISAGRVKFGN